jgi:glycosyltransferase involved in cell wall biosynthesis
MPAKPSVCFLNRCYWPDAEATGQLLTQLCEHLAPRWDVTAVVGKPNYAMEDARVEQPVRNGVRIERLPHLSLPKANKAGRLANLLSFTNQVRRWGRRPQAAADVLVCETDPFFLPIVTRRIARRSGAKLVFYLQDIYPDVAVAVGVIREGRVARAIRKRLRAAYTAADRIVVLDEDMRNRLTDWGIDPGKICIVPNWVDCDVVRPIKLENGFRRREQIDDRFVVMHSGNMGMTQRLDVLVEAFCRDEIPKRALLALVGGGAKREPLETHCVGQGNVRFWDYQPMERLGESLSAADLHVISMDERITGCIAPSKLYGILGSGTPILAIVPEGSAVWKFVQEHGLGWTVVPGDTEGIARAVSEASQLGAERLAEMGQRGRALAEQQFERTRCCDRFEAVLEAVVAM